MTLQLSATKGRVNYVQHLPRSARFGAISRSHCHSLPADHSLRGKGDDTVSSAGGFESAETFLCLSSNLSGSAARGLGMTPAVALGVYF